MQLRTKLLAGGGLVGLAVAAFVAVNAAEVFSPSAQPVGYIGQPVPSNLDVSGGNEKMFSIDYNSYDWSGNLHAYPITKSGAIGASDAWTGGGAAGAIAKQSAESRIIVTRKETGTGGMPFRWSSMSKGDTGYRKLLDPAAMDATSSDIVNFLRGDTSKELKQGGSLRSRGSVLGDIIHSTPAYDSTTKTVYVGANDGMLHAFNAENGSERFAYVPGALVEALPKLAVATDFTHRYYVDGGIAVRTIDAQTILVGALGGGGQALYALDVTSMPADETSAASKVLWEVSNKTADYKDLGYTYSAPVLIKLKETSGAVAAAVVGNGYYGDPATSSQHAVLYVMNAKTGTLIRAIDTNVGSATTPNGLSSPSVRDTDNDGFSDTAYAGDLLGNMWMFDLLKGTSKLLYDGGSDARAITTAPGLAAHPAGGAMVLFVTGRMLTPGDVTSKQVQYAVGVWDKPDTGKGSYVTQTLNELTYDPTNTKLRVRTVTKEKLNYTNNVNRGWKVALPAGERVVGDGAYVNDKVFQFFSTNPTLTPDAKPPGENWWMQLNYLTGSDTSSVLFDLNDDRAFSTDDLIFVKDPGATTSTTMYPVGRHMGGGVRSQLVGVSAGGIDVFQASFDRNGAPKPPVVVDVKDELIKGERGVAGGHFDTDFFCYVRCGNQKERNDGNSSYTNYSPAAGYYAFGRAGREAIDGAGINYVHVHEYDDIYDVIGLSMINPSQDLQRLHTVAAATTTTVSSPNTPLLKANKQYPPEATQVGTPEVITTKETANTEKDGVTYLLDTEIEYVSGPVPTLVAGKMAMVTTRQYKSTAVINAYEYSASGDPKAKYLRKWTKTLKTWTTTITESATSTNTEFKLLMANQQHSPAISFKVLGALTAGAQAEYDGPVIQYQTQANLKVADLPKYSMASVKEMMWSMPLYAFNVQEWVPGEKRTGVHPMHPNCAGIATYQAQRGKNKEWRNGALTLQIVAADIAQTDIELNVAGQPKLGYRLKSGRYESGGKLIAEYLIYWHHPLIRCMTDTSGDAAYTMAPKVTDKLAGAPAVPGKPALGSKDPHGEFVPKPGTPVEIPPPPPPTVTKNADGSITTIVWTHVPQGTDGGYIRKGTSTTVWPNGGSGIGGPGAGDAGGVQVGGETEACAGAECTNGNGGGTANENGKNSKAPNTGRINWRELQR
ncbi:hypothetical protein INH39_31075 [Massilia violaceinigra]|uniref:PilY1 beta-propeller domain-containing protein n=1 Tax=Massilia violaceinigra TaxID=2045208 RepID=A0ABY4A6Y6_9BURK|nr:PilC/PilY family type IV pilus protein [Massilia violaceinigra]UOD29769.1 hypothetical protein INH39_31075 [Massilia violaceinigra]